MSILVSDICGTLVYENTTRGFLTWLAEHGYRSGEIKSALSRPVSWLSARSGLDVGRRWLVWTLRSASREWLESEAEAYVSDALQRAGRKSVIEALRNHAASGQEVVLASATLEPVALAFQHALGADRTVSSLLDYDDHGRCTGSLRLDTTGRKWRSVQAMLPPSSREPIIVYTDNHDDLDIMQHADRVVFFGTPSSAMREQLHPDRLTTMPREAP